MLNMSEKKLTDEQQRKKDALIREFEERISQIPEKQGPHNVLDGGGGIFNDLGIEFKKRLKEILDE